MTPRTVQAPYDLDAITFLVGEGSRVLDLGCGDGSLLEKLRDEKNAKIQGIDIDPDMIRSCVARRVPVVQDNLDEGLCHFADGSFDYVILSHTLQVVKRPEAVLDGMLRVGRKAIVSIPNFGYWVTRFQIFFGGRMPVNKNLPYQWYNSPNLHFCTIRDLRALIREKGWRIEKEFHLSKGKMIHTPWPNLLAAEVVVLIQRD